MNTNQLNHYTENVFRLIGRCGALPALEVPEVHQDQIRTSEKLIGLLRTDSQH